MVHQHLYGRVSATGTLKRCSWRYARWFEIGREPAFQVGLYGSRRSARIWEMSANTISPF